MFVRKFLVTVMIFCISVPFALTQEKKDPFDLSATDKNLAELGVPTVPEVEALEQQAKTFYSNENWEKAASALEEYAKKANWLSNIIAAGIEPYYGADYDDRKEYPYSKLKPLIPFETKANDYKKKRNRAMVMQAECLINLGQKDKAVSLLIKALDLINIKNEEWWNRARKQLYLLIEID